MPIESPDRLVTPAAASYPVTEIGEVSGAYLRVANVAAMEALPAKIKVLGQTSVYVVDVDRWYVWTTIMGEDGEVEAWALAPEDVSRKISALDASIGVQIYPGDGGVALVRDRLGKVGLGVRSDGTAIGAFAQEDILNAGAFSGYPGDGIALVKSAGGVQLGINPDGSLLAVIFPDSIQQREIYLPGDGVGLLRDRTGKFAIYVEPDGTLRCRVRAEDIVGLEDGGGNGGTVEVAQPSTHAPVMHAMRIGEDAILYLSRQWRGEVHGFEERGPDPAVTLAQSPKLASIVASFGGGSVGVERDLGEERYYWHIRDKALENTDQNDATQAFAVAWLTLAEDVGLALPTMLCAPKPIGSTTEADAIAGSAYRLALKADVAAAKAALEGFGKIGMVEFVLLQLLDGQQDEAELTADFIYAATAASLRDEIAGDQPLAPFFVVNQSIGTRTDGTSEVILAEGLLEQRHFDLGFVVATPLYWCRLETDGAATLHPEDAMLVSELQAHACHIKEQGGTWYCPRIQDARITGDTITVTFTTLSNLVLEDPVEHGFAIDGVANGAGIASVTASGNTVTIAMTAAPTGTLTLRYAWGETGDPGDDKPANRGSLRDSWAAPSRFVPDITLRRWALAGKAAITEE